MKCPQCEDGEILISKEYNPYNQHEYRRYFCTHCEYNKLEEVEVLDGRE